MVHTDYPSIPEAEAVDQEFKITLGCISAVGQFRPETLFKKKNKTKQLDKARPGVHTCNPSTGEWRHKDQEFQVIFNYRIHLKAA